MFFSKFVHCWWCHVMVSHDCHMIVTWLSRDWVHLKSWFIALRSCSVWSSGKISNSKEGNSRKEILHLMEMTVVSKSISLYSPRETKSLEHKDTWLILQGRSKNGQKMAVVIQVMQMSKWAIYSSNLYSVFE